MAKTILPIHKRIQDALDKIGTSNGTKMPDATLPLEIPQGNNEAINAFFEKHARVRDYYVLDVMLKHIEGRHKHAKREVLHVLGIDESKLGAGESKSYTFDNVSLAYKTTAGRSNLSRPNLLVALTTQLASLVPGAKNLSLTEAAAVIDAATTTGKPPLSLIPSTTAE